MAEPARVTDAASEKQARIAEVHAFKRRAILSAAREVIARQGAAALTIRNVAKAAGYTPGAVYSYYANKDDLALELLSSDLHDLTRYLKGRDDKRAGENDDVRLAALLSDLVTKLQDGNVLAQTAPLFDTAANPADSEMGRALTGRIIQMLTLMAGPLAVQGHDADDTNRLAVTFAALALGTAALEKSGRLSVPASCW